MLEERRHKLRLTREELAEKSGVAARVIFLAEAGYTVPPETFHALVSAMHGRIVMRCEPDSLQITQTIAWESVQPFSLEKKER
jgi:predicted transcriptional regulator